MLVSQHGVRLGQTYIRYFDRGEKFLEEIVFSPDVTRTFKTLLPKLYRGLGGTSEEGQHSGILGKLNLTCKLFLSFSAVVLYIYDLTL